MPALFTHMSMPPNRARAVSAVKEIEAGSPTSSGVATTVPPVRSAISAAAAAALVSSTSPISTDAPASTSLRAIAWPASGAPGDHCAPAPEGQQFGQRAITQVRDNHGTPPMSSPEHAQCSCAITPRILRPASRSSTARLISSSR